MEGRSGLTVLLEGLEGITLIIICTVLWRILRYFLQNLGATKEERDKDWPGDALHDHIDHASTHAIEIDADPEQIWPWIVQIGRDKAGFYSYELVENLAGFRVTNRETLLPEYQTLSEGEFISLHPNGEGVYVAMVKPPELLVCKTWESESELEEKRFSSKDTWSLYIVKGGERKSRLIVRSCKESLRPDFVQVILTLLFKDPVDFVMERKMMRTIKRLAEGLERS